MMQVEIEDKLKSYLLENFYHGEPTTLTNTVELLTSGIIDSISALELVDYIEENFNIEFEAHEVDQENLNTINSLTSFILKKLNPS